MAKGITGLVGRALDAWESAAEPTSSADAAATISARI